MDQAEKTGEAVDESLDDNSEEEYDVGTSSEDDLIVCNGLDHSIFVEVAPTNLRRKFESPLKKFLNWFDFQITDWQGQIDHTEGSLYKLRLKHQEIKAHQMEKIKMGKDDDKKWTMLECSVQLRLYHQVEDKEEEGLAEIGSGYIVGPGRGIIVNCWGNGQEVVEQAKSLKWWRKYDPWVPNRSDDSRNPHKGLKKTDKCLVCSS